MSDNVIKFPYKIRRTSKPVPMVCEMASERFEQIVVLGSDKQDQIQMVTTLKDPAEVLWYLETARFSIMQGMEDDEGYYDE
jgi:hypothetical protein|tara:strand:+ start:94 stop:336 length:243 start_codon:yes stop_codon:yes gene_type:complete